MPTSASQSGMVLIISRDFRLLVGGSSTTNQPTIRPTHYTYIISSGIRTTTEAGLFIGQMET